MKTDVKTHLISTEFQLYLDLFQFSVFCEELQLSKLSEDVGFIPYNTKLHVILKFPHWQKWFLIFFLRTMRHPLQINSTKKPHKRSKKLLPSLKLNSYRAQNKLKNTIKYSRRTYWSD